MSIKVPKKIDIVFLTNSFLENIKTRNENKKIKFDNLIDIEKVNNKTRSIEFLLLI